MLNELNVNNYNNGLVGSKMLLTEQDTAKILGIPKKSVQDLIASGMLQGIPTNGKTYVSRYALAEMLGEKSAVNFGQHACGQTQPVALYYGQQFEDCEDDSMIKQYKGSVSTLKDGGYMAQVDMGRTPDGKRIRPSKRFKTKEDAERYLSQRLKELNGDISPRPEAASYDAAPVVANADYTDKTFEEYATAILNRGIGQGVSRTIDGYRVSVIPVLEHIGNIKMVDIDRDRLIGTFNKLAKKYGSVSLKKAFNTTKMLFEEAFNNEEIPKNPFLNLKVPPSQVMIESYRNAYTDDEIALIFEKAKEYCNKMLYPMLVVLECTGMRPGELRAMEWKNTNLEAKNVFISNAVVTRFEEIENLRKRPKSYEAIGPTKSESGVRKVGLSDLAVQALKEWRKELDTMPSAMRDSKYVFPSQDGSFRTESSNKCLVQRFVKKAGIADMHFMLYRFRHTVCTRMFLAGISIDVVQKVLGDNTSAVVTKIYNHMTQEQALAACSDYYEMQNQKNAKILKN